MADKKYRHPQVNLRLPEEIKDDIVKLADRHGRSANAEMVAAITAWLDTSKKPLPLKVDLLLKKVGHLEKMLTQLLHKDEDA